MTNSPVCVILLFLGTSVSKVSAMNNTTILPSATITSLPNTASSAQSLSHNISINTTPTSTLAQPSPSPTASGDSAQVNVGGSSKDIADPFDVPLPPDTERRDFELIANTKLKWVRYLLDKTGAEYKFMKKYSQNIFNNLFKNVDGFVKTEMTDFFEEKVTFKLNIYTMKKSMVVPSKLKSLVDTYMNSEKNTLKIYAFEIQARFQDMAPDDSVRADYGPALVPAAEPVNGFVAFMTGFGVMLGMILVCTAIVVGKYKVCQKINNKNQIQDNKDLLQNAHVNEAME